MGGTENHLLQVMPRLFQYGLDPKIYTLTHRGDLADAMAMKGVPVMTVPFSFFLRRIPIYFRKPLLLFLTTIRLWGIMMFRRPALVHFFLPEAYIIGAICSIVAGVQPRLMSRRSLNHYQKSHSRLTRIEYWLHNWTDKVLGNSNAVMKELALEDIPQSRLGLIYNGIEIEYWKKTTDISILRKKMLISSNTLVLILVANLIPYKGHTDLLEALGFVQEKLPKEWALLCIGRDQGIQKKLEEKANLLGISNQV